MSMTRRKFLAGVSLAAGASARGQQDESRRSHEDPAGSRTVPRVSWSRSVPVRYEAAVAVIGGGIAGVSAACAAARSGAKVVLVERFAVTGGNCTSGGVASFCGETAGQGEVFDTIVGMLEKWDAIRPYKPYPKADNRVFDHAVLAVVLQELLLRRGVKLLLHTRFVDACERGGRITDAIVCGKSGPEALRAKQFVDCTGEAELTRAAGFEVVKGRPEDQVQLPMSMMTFVRHVSKGKAGPQVPEGWFKPIRRREDLPMTSIWPNGPGGNALKIKVPLADSTGTESMTDAEIRARRRMMAVIDYFQRIEGKPWRYDHCSPRIGIREGCRVVGDYTLKVEDLRAAREFDDAVARGVYCLDAHKPDDEGRTYILPPDQRTVPPYQIPLRSLIVRDGKNLLAAGRCFSADQLALSSARVTTSCSMMGQAAGIAAAVAAAEGVGIRGIDAAEVREVVEKRGARLGV